METKEVLVSFSDGDMHGDCIRKISLQCLDCKHLYSNLMSCAAFPDGIPEIILGGGWDHSKAFEGDEGVRYESKDIKL